VSFTTGVTMIPLVGFSRGRSLRRRMRQVSPQFLPQWFNFILTPVLHTRHNITPTLKLAYNIGSSETAGIFWNATRSSVDLSYKYYTNSTTYSGNGNTPIMCNDDDVRRIQIKISDDQYVEYYDGKLYLINSEGKRSKKTHTLLLTDDNKSSCNYDQTTTITNQTLVDWAIEDADVENPNAYVPPLIVKVISEPYNYNKNNAPTASRIQSKK